MNWLNALIYFNDEADFIIWSKLCINIFVYKFLWKIAQKIYFIYIYIYSDRYLPKKFNYQFMSEWMNMLIYEQPILPSAQGRSGTIS